MRLLIVLFSICVLVGCSSTPVESSQVSKSIAGEESTYAKDLEEVLLKKSNQTSYLFTVKMMLQNQETIWQGEHSNKDWTIKSAKPIPVTISKKGEKVAFQFKNQVETLNTEQTGVISPLDHFQLVSEIKKEVKLASTESKNKKTWVTLNVGIDEQLLAQKIKKRLLNSKDDYSFVPVISDQVKIKYQITYLKESNELTELSMKIESKDGQKEEIVYSFQ